MTLIVPNTYRDRQHERQLELLERERDILKGKVERLEVELITYRDRFNKLSDDEKEIYENIEEERDRYKKRYEEEHKENWHTSQNLVQLFQILGLGYDDRRAFHREDCFTSESIGKAAEQARLCIQRGIHFQQLLDCIKSNEVLQAQWNRFLVSIKMVSDEAKPDDSDRA